MLTAILVTVINMNIDTKVVSSRREPTNKSFCLLKIFSYACKLMKAYCEFLESSSMAEKLANETFLIQKCLIFVLFSTFTVNITAMINMMFYS